MKRLIAEVAVVITMALLLISCPGGGKTLGYYVDAFLDGTLIVPNTAFWKAQMGMAFTLDSNPSWGALTLGQDVHQFIAGSSGTGGSWAFQLGNPFVTPYASYPPVLNPFTVMPGSTQNLGTLKFTASPNPAQAPTIGYLDSVGIGTPETGYIARMCVNTHGLAYWGMISARESNGTIQNQTAQHTSDPTLPCQPSESGFSANFNLPTTPAGFDDGVYFLASNTMGAAAASFHSRSFTNTFGAPITSLDVATNGPTSNWTLNGNAVTPTTNSYPQTWSSINTFGSLNLQPSYSLSVKWRMDGVAAGSIKFDGYAGSALQGNVATGKVGNLTGRIIDKTSKQPVQGATVTISRGGNSYTATTDANGNYTFTGLPAADFANGGLTYKGTVTKGTSTTNISGQVFTGANDWGDTEL